MLFVNGPGPNGWMKLWRQSAAKGDPLPCYQELVNLYSQPHRHYHNLGHISECLAEFGSARHLAQEPVAVEWAIWFHDAVYEPRAQDNEEQSARLAQRWLGAAGVGERFAGAVTYLVLATKTHVPSRHPDAALIIDIDLSILGKPPRRFEEYEAQIRREYAWVPEAVFAAKRAEMLERFLARERLYATGRFFTRFEAAARSNLQASVARLKQATGASKT